MKNIKKTYIESEVDKFFKDYGDKNIYISYDKDKDSIFIFIIPNIDIFISMIF